MAGKDWIKGAVKHKGALHKELDVPKGKKTPEKKLEKAGARAKKTDNTKLERQISLAKTLKKMKK